MILKASARRDGGGLRHVLDVNGRHQLITDEPTALGGDDSGPAPHELLPAVLAACISTMIALYAKNREWDIGELSVDVLYDTDVTPRRFDVTVNLSENLSEEQLKRLRKVAESCPVRRAMEAGFEFHEQFIPIPAHNKSVSVQARAPLGQQGA